jgi:hypothetical protein
VFDVDSSNDCVQDCEGTWGGDAEMVDFYNDIDGDGLGAGDAANVCDAFSPDGWVTNNDDSDDACYSNIHDCFGECDGTALVDDCGVCEGSNDTCYDCNGDINGTAYYDDCGVCDSIPSNDNLTCEASEDLIVDDNETIYLFGAHQYKNVIITNSSKIIVSEYHGQSENRGKLLITCDSLFIDGSSSINAKGKGGFYGEGIGGQGNEGEWDELGSGGGGGHANFGGSGGGLYPGVGGNPYATDSLLSRGSMGGFGAWPAATYIGDKTTCCPRNINFTFYLSI